MYVMYMYENVHVHVHVYVCYYNVRVHVFQCYYVYMYKRYVVHKQCSISYNVFMQ